MADPQVRHQRHNNARRLLIRLSPSDPIRICPQRRAWTHPLTDLRTTAENLHMARCARRGPVGRTPGQFRHRLQDARFNFDALFDKGRTRRNKETRRKPTLHARIREEWTDREDTELELLMLGFPPGASGERHEAR